MLWIVVPVMAVVISLVIWLKQNTSYQQTFLLFSSTAKADLHQYLSSPCNLPEYHPSITTVTDVFQADGADCVHCTIEENVGLVGRVKVPLVVSASPDLLSPSIRLDFLDDNVKVSVKVKITDTDDSDDSQMKSKIETSVTVDSWRLVTLLVSRFLTKKWAKALTNAMTVVEH